MARSIVDSFEMDKKTFCLTLQVSLLFGVVTCFGAVHCDLCYKYNYLSYVTRAVFY